MKIPNNDPHETNNQAIAAQSKAPWAIGLSLLLGVFLASLGLAWLSSRGQGVQGWTAFLAVFLLAGGLVLGVWRLLKGEAIPRWLVLLLALGVAIRLAAGVCWFIAMPVWGHGSLAERAGYVMADASTRDRAAWKLSQSNKPLLNAFRGKHAGDQYGGLLYLSASIYRYSGADFHRPLLMVVLTATVSSLAIWFTWAFARRAWGDQTALIAAILLTVYPEAVLLGSSQMREAFTMTLTMAAFFGLIRYLQDRSWTSIAWMLVPLLLYLPFSPPFTALLMVMIALVLLTNETARRGGFENQWWLWAALGLVVLLVLAGLWLSLRQLAPKGMNNPITMLSWWLRKSAQLQAYLSQHSSGWVQKIFKYTPEWSHLPLLMAYGVVQPFLPAAIIVGSHSPVWPWITLWRAVGWTLLLVFLVYAPLLAVRKRDDHGFTISITVVVWLGILAASLRGGGDLWDNPRYRAAFAGLQIALAAWAWVEHRRTADPWLRRAFIAIASIVAWFLPWYLRRYTPFDWPVVDLFKTLGLGAATAALLVLADWARSSAASVQDTNSPSDRIPPGQDRDP